MLSTPAHPTRRGERLTVFFTGLSGAAKSPTAQVLFERLLEIGSRERRELACKTFM